MERLVITKQGNTRIMKVIFNYISDNFKHQIFNDLVSKNILFELFIYKISECDSTLLDDMNISNAPLNTLAKQTFLLSQTSKFIMDQAAKGNYYDSVITVIDYNNNFPPEHVPKNINSEIGKYNGLLYKDLNFAVDPNVFVTHPLDFISITNFWKMCQYFTPKNFASWNESSRWRNFTDEDGYKLVWGQWLYMNRLNFQQL